MSATLDSLPPAYQRAARGLRLPYFYGTPVAYRTIEELDGVDSWDEADPECRRRNAGLWIYCAVVHGVKYGFGQMARDRARALANWQANPNQFSHPDVSFHVRDPQRKLEPVACDTVGTGPGGSPPDGFAAMRANAHLFGLHLVTGSTERHHTQLFPGSKRTWNANPQPVTTWSNFPALPGDQEEDELSWHEPIPNYIKAEDGSVKDEAWSVLSGAHAEAYHSQEDTQRLVEGLLDGEGYSGEGDGKNFWNGIRDIVKGEVAAQLKPVLDKLDALAPKA
jgi:hypothetical protein